MNDEWIVDPNCPKDTVYFGYYEWIVDPNCPKETVYFGYFDRIEVPLAEPYNFTIDAGESEVFAQITDAGKLVVVGTRRKGNFKFTDIA